jgi:hypothetical protein
MNVFRIPELSPISGPALSLPVIDDLFAAAVQASLAMVAEV